MLNKLGKIKLFFATACKDLMILLHNTIHFRRDKSRFVRIKSPSGKTGLKTKCTMVFGEKLTSGSLPVKVKILPSSSPSRVPGNNCKSRTKKVMQVNVNSFVTTLSKQSLKFYRKALLVLVL